MIPFLDMRMTLTIDDGLAKTVKALLTARASPSSRSSTRPSKRAWPPDAPAKARPYPVVPVSLGGVLPGIDLTRVLLLAECGG